MINKLPEELLSRIISDVDSCQDISRCRLVCKQWCILAEPLMFSKQIVIKTERAAVSLFAQLYTKPNLAKHIKRFKLEYEFIPSSVLEALIPLVFTSSMEYFTGVADHDCYTVMLDMSSQEPGGFNKLKTIPYPEYYTRTYNETLLAFKNSLEEIALVSRGQIEDDEVPNVVDRLGEFSKLKKIKLDTVVATLEDLENILPASAGLEEVVFDIKIHEVLLSKTAIEAWNAEAVRRVETVKKLVFTREFRSDLIEYLVFKYPSVDTIEINTEAKLVLTRNNVKRLLDAIHDIDTVHVSFIVTDVDLGECLNHLATPGHHFVIKDASEGFRIEIKSK